MRSSHPARNDGARYFRAMFRSKGPARAFAAGVALFLLSGGAVAQRFSVKLYGIVTDHFTGAPVKGVLVRLLKAGATEAQCITRSDGRYEFLLDRGWRPSARS